MIALLADENVNNDIVRGVRRRARGVDLLTVQDVGLEGMSDPLLLEWAVANHRVILTHDVRTFPGFAYERIRAGLPMLGVFVVSDRVAVGVAVDEIVLVAECSEASDWQNQVQFLPL